MNTPREDTTDRNESAEAMDDGTEHVDSIEFVRGTAGDGTSGMVVVKAGFVDEEDPYRYL